MPDRMPDKMIEAVGLTKFYGDFLAIDDVSFSVGRGETVGLLGTNGAGKTTTMRILTGYMPPSRGVVRVAGCDVAADSLGARRRIGYLPEAAPLYGDMTVAASLQFFGRVRAMEAANLRRAVDSVLETFGLTAYRDTLVGKLSKGYRQRLGFALAVLHEPEVLILDEPTASIDPLQVVDARDLIRRLGERHTILLSTHQLSEASSLCERVVILHEGEVAAQGRPREIAAALRDAQRFSVQVRGPQDRATNVLLNADGVWAVDCVGSSEDGVHSFEVTGAPHEDLAETIASALIGAGLGLRQLAHANVDLEEIFLQVTRERGQVTTERGERESG